MKPIHVGLLGIGTVGGGTFNVLRRNQSEIQRRAGRGIEISIVADKDVAKARALVGDGVKVVDDAFAVVRDPDVDIVVELIGGYTIAKDLILAAIHDAQLKAKTRTEQEMAKLAETVGLPPGMKLPF